MAKGSAWNPRSERVPVIDTTCANASRHASGSVPSSTPTQFHRSVSVAVSTSGVPRDELT
eukprot:3889764-Prymnesium_polylepis.1